MQRIGVREILMRYQVYFAAAVLFIAIAAPVNSARTEGALAIGIPADFAKDGFAVGGAINFPNRAEAERRALQECRDFKGAPKATVRCAVVANFKRECYAIAFDPDTGTHGYGFAVAQTRAVAEDRAMAACRMRSDENRRNACRLDLVRCDEND
jgi:hypothetical protein